MTIELPPESPIDLQAIAERRSWLLSFARPNSIGAEFGVFRGHFATVIARELKPRKLFLVDPWTKLGERFGWGPDPYTNFDNLTTAQAMLDTRHRMAAYEATSEIVYVEDTLENFARDMKTYTDRKLDFAYLDAGHTYEDVSRQLDILARIVAHDGVIFGDDWYPDLNHQHHGVMRAVNAFLKLYDFQLVVAGPANQFCIRRTPKYRS
jgi:Methyltransferase domain